MNKRILISLFSILCTMSAMAQVDGFYPLQKDLEYVGIDYLKDEEKAKSIGLPHAYSGKGVLVAVIDMGFNSCNMAFIDPQTRQQRIKYVYFSARDQLYDSPDDIASDAKKEVKTSHGLHSTSIAAGNYPDSIKCLAGVATASDIICCYDSNDRTSDDHHFYTKQLHVIDSIATLLNVPCVVNLSKASYGLGFFLKENPYTDQFDKFTGCGKTPGRVVCVASDNIGNQNGKPVIKHQFSSDTDTIRILSKTLGNGSEDAVGAIFICCQDTNLVKLNVNMYDTDKRAIVDDFKVTDWFDSTITSISDIRNEIECQEDMYGQQFVNLNQGFHDSAGKLALAYEITGKAGTSVSIHLIEINDFVPDGYSVYNDTIPIGNVELMCMTPSVLSVGSIATKQCKDPTYPNSNYVYSAGEVAHDSGWGVDYYGTTYPDVCAPGVSLLLSDGEYAETAPYTITDYSGDKISFDYHSGTSYACPMTAGVVALMLEQDPTLTVERIRTLLYQTNDFTEACHNTVGPIGGHGILNAPKLMKALIAEQTGIAPVNMNRDDSDTHAYDLMGRVVDPKAYHGIIIKNGRKFVNM